MNDEVLKKQMVSGVNRIICFVRTQEEEWLRPILANSAKLLQIAENGNEYLDSLNLYADEDLKQTNDILQRLGTLDKAIGKTPGLKDTGLLHNAGDKFSTCSVNWWSLNK